MAKEVKENFPIVSDSRERLNKIKIKQHHLDCAVKKLRVIFVGRFQKSRRVEDQARGVEVKAINVGFWLSYRSRIWLFNG